MAHIQTSTNNIRFALRLFCGLPFSPVTLQLLCQFVAGDHLPILRPAKFRAFPRYNEELARTFPFHAGDIRDTLEMWRESTEHSETL